MKSVADEIFQTEQIFPAGYIPIGQYLKNMVTFSANRDADQHITNPINHESIDSTWEELSEYEKIIASHLLYGFYNAYIFSGGMGSGKTSTATHVLKFIKSKFNTPNSAFIKIAFDFNLGVINEDENNGKEIIERFTQELYTKLKIAIQTHIENHETDLVRNLLRYIESVGFDEYSEFFDLRSIVNDISWLDFKSQKKAAAFISFVERENNKITRIEMFMKFFRFLKEELTENEFIIIFYDNIDILNPNLQNKLFHDYILPLNTIAKTKCLISLRRTTFLRSFDFRDIRFAQSFGFIHHHGHKVSDIINQRLNYWNEKIEGHNFFKQVDQKYKDAFKKRISFLHREFTSKPHQHSLANYVDSLAGNCVRLGLYISHRFLINNIIKFDESPQQRDRYKKALIVNTDSNTLLSNYEEIVNLFVADNKFSILPIRVLHLVRSINDRDGIKIQVVLDILSKYYTKDSIISIIKMLLYSRRPLLWIDRVDSNELDAQASLFITEIGTGYIESLLSDLTYIQECFMVAEWDSDIVPLTVDVQSEYERLSSIVKCLRVTFDEDYDSLQKLDNDKITFFSTDLIHTVIDTIITLNLSAGYTSIYNDIEDLLSYVLSVKNIESNKLEKLLTTTQNLKK
jgi:hypothetical protein